MRGSVEKGQPYGNEGDEDESRRGRFGRRGDDVTWSRVLGIEATDSAYSTTIDTGRTYPTKVRPELSRFVGMYLSDSQALVPYTTTKSFIRVLLNPNLTRRLTAEQTLSYTWSRSLRGTRRRNQTPRDENTYRLHRRMIVSLGGGLGGLMARAQKQQRRGVSNVNFPNVATTQNRGR